MYQYTMQMTGELIDCASALTLDELSVARTGAAADDVGAMAKMSSLPLLLEHLRLDALNFLPRGTRPQISGDLAVCRFCSIIE